MTHKLALKKKTDALIVFRDLSEEEYAEYNQSLILISEFSFTDNLYRIQKVNYEELWKAQTSAVEEFSKNPWAANCLSFENTELNLNRHLLNYLTSVRTFLDHTELKLKRRYGENSYQYMNFKQSTSHAYDDCFSYRFVYSLRNYYQHCGMPIGKMGLNSRKGELGTANSLLIMAHRDDLVKSKVWKKEITEEIQALQEDFDLLPHIQTMLLV